MPQTATTFSRRQFGFGTAALCGLAAGAPISRIFAAQHAAASIDVHCHVFNASDLSVGGFLRRVTFEDYADQVQVSALKPPSFVSGLIATLVRFLSKDVITARQELDRLRSGVQAIAKPFDPHSQAAQDALTEALRDVLEQDESALQQNRQTYGGVELRRDDIDTFAASIQRELASAPGSQAAMVAATDFRAMAAGLFTSNGIIGRHVRWAAMLRGPRSDNVRRLQQLYGPDGVRLYTPALVNYAQWLDEDPRSGFRDQVLVMEEIQKRNNSAQTGLVHCFAPYDPWQQVADELNGETETSLSIAQDAVENRGFIGVKLYPPMGFLPANNATTNLKLPERVLKIPDFKAKIDAALEALYYWAESNDVPIMAHANNSNGAGPDYALRAHPRHWISVLENHPGLRLNLAHFGGFDEMPGSQNWEDTIGINLHRFVHLYADISYLSEALPATGSARRRQIVTALSAFTEKHDPHKQRLLYGSDWIMLGRESDHGRYFSHVQGLVADAGFDTDEWARVRRGNAIAYLGLSPSSASRRRLQRWYESHNLDPAMLTIFD